MNAKKCKLARLRIGFDPHAPRTYQVGEPLHKRFNSLKGRQYYVVSGTIISTGDRRRYQAFKRHAVKAHL